MFHLRLGLSTWHRSETVKTTRTCLHIINNEMRNININDKCSRSYDLFNSLFQKQTIKKTDCLPKNDVVRLDFLPG